MSAYLKSHVLRRDEKGFGGISFGRLLFGFMAGGSVYALGKGLLGDLGSILGGLSMMIFYVFMTGQKGGIPRFKRIQYGIRGTLMLSAFQSRGGFVGQVCRVLELDYDHMVVVDGNRVFKTKKSLSEDEGSLVDWEFMDQPNALGSGSRFVDRPVVEIKRRQQVALLQGDGRATIAEKQAVGKQVQADPVTAKP